MRKAAFAGACGCVLALAAGCALVETAPPERLAQSVAENRTGEQLARRGDNAAAIVHFRRALRAAESIEDAEAIAANLISLSILQQRVGDRDAAIGSVERILRNRGPGFSERRLAEAAVRRALLAYEAGDVGEARSYTDRAHGLCRESCPVRAKIAVLQGYLALAAGEADRAQTLARRAMSVSQSTEDREERANALRLLGSALLSLGDPAAALAPLEEALQLDKQLALARSIAYDLLALARAHERAGNAGLARAYLERAHAVAAADNNRTALEQAQAGLDRLPAASAAR